jgi:hypothetical protein
MRLPVLRAAAFSAILVLLSACGTTPHHLGLSRDGYGFTEGSSHLPPPDDLEKPAR